MAADPDEPVENDPAQEGDAASEESAPNDESGDADEPASSQESASEESKETEPESDDANQDEGSSDEGEAQQGESADEDGGDDDKDGDDGDDDDDSAMVATSDDDDDGSNTLVMGGDSSTIRFRLFDSFTAAMSDVPYRVKVGDQTKEDTTSDGWVEVETEEVPEKATVEWGAADEPGAYRYTREVYLQFEDLDDDEARKRRLHNLGYDEDGDATENLDAFREHYGVQSDEGSLLVSWFEDPEQIKERGEPLQGGDAPEPPPLRDPQDDTETSTTFRVRLHDALARPLATGRYKVTVGDQTVEKQADGDGWTEEIESGGAETCRLEWGYPEDEEYSYAMDVRIEAVAKEETTWMLHHLGYPQDGDGRENILAFQRDYDLQDTGELDEPTKSKLHALHQSCELGASDPEPDP
jgi:hypothetical protein